MAASYSGRRADGIGIVQAQHEFSAVAGREQVVGDGGAQVADMEVAGGAGREAEAGGCGCSW